MLIIIILVETFAFQQYFIKTLGKILKMGTPTYIIALSNNKIHWNEKNILNTNLMYIMRLLYVDF